MRSPVVLRCPLGAFRVLSVTQLRVGSRMIRAHVPCPIFVAHAHLEPAVQPTNSGHCAGIDGGHCDSSRLRADREDAGKSGAQTCDPARFEILVVANGPDDGTSDTIRRRARSSRVPIRLVQTPISGFANARNLGIHSAGGEFVTWVDDDDDWVSTTYVAAM